MHTSDDAAFKATPTLMKQVAPKAISAIISAAATAKEETSLRQDQQFHAAALLDIMHVSKMKHWAEISTSMMGNKSTTPLIQAAEKQQKTQLQFHKAIDCCVEIQSFSLMAITEYQANSSGHSKISRRVVICL